MNKTIKILIPLLVFMLLVLPIFSLAQEKPDLGLIPCDNTPDENGNIPNLCGFKEFLSLVNNVIGFLLLKLAVPLAAIMFAYAGFLLIQAQGGEAKTKAKNIFTNTALGLVFAAAAWIIIRTLLLILGYEGSWIGF